MKKYKCKDKDCTTICTFKIENDYTKPKHCMYDGHKTKWKLVKEKNNV